MSEDSYRALIKKFLKWIDGFSLFDFFYSDLTSFELTELHSVAKEMDLKDYKYVNIKKSEEEKKEFESRNGILTERTRK